MNERNLIGPGEYLWEDDRRYLVFLVGPIFGAPRWQDVASAYIHQLHPEIVVVNPCLPVPDPNLSFGDQLSWERHYRRMAGDPRHGATLVWLPVQEREAHDRDYAQTSRYELGELAAWHQHWGSLVSLGIELGFHGERYIRHCWKLECPDVTVSDSLQAACEKVVTLCPRPTNGP